MKFDIEEIVKIISACPVAGKAVGAAEAAAATIAKDKNSAFVPTELITDSRSFRCGPGTLFFALSTGSGDGHNFIEDLYGRGVRHFVVSHVPEASLPEAQFLVVDSPLKALQRLGAECRRRSQARVVGITGSRGKTMVKEWLNAALEPSEGVVRSPRSFNSQIGVPLSLTEIEPDTAIAIIEAGISTTGEMQRLSDMIAPDVVVFTTLSEEHAEGFANMQQKAAEKALLAQNASTVVYPADNVELSAALAPYADGRQMLGWSRKDPQAPLFVKAVRHEDDGYVTIEYVFEGRDESVRVKATEGYEVDNAVSVLATMLASGYEPARIACGMMRLPHIGTRINVTDGVNDCLLAFDDFTADALSLESALDFMHRRIRATADHRTPVLILSDLHIPAGTSETEAYAEVARMVREAGVDKLICIGPRLKAHASLFGDGARFFADTASMMTHMSTSDFTREFILLKGAPEFDFASIMHNLEARTHETVLEVNLNAIERNFNYFRSHLPASTGLIAMVKASAYGAGPLEIAKTLQSQGAAYLAVAVLDEGLDLRHAGITMPIMVMNPKVVNYRAMFAGRLEPEIYSQQMLCDVIREALKCGIKDYPIHIKLDTGMHRMGFNEEELPLLIETLRGTDTVKAATLFSHLATADCPDMNDYTELQLERFARYTDTIAAALPYPLKRHTLNSAGILRYSEKHHYDFARLGIGLYGVNTLPPEMEEPLSVVSTLRTVIIAIAERAEGESVGYARRTVLKRHSRIATIPIGYADGMNRKFGNGRICVLVNGRECPTVGNICMDACMIDVTDVDCRVGDSVEIFGENMPVARLAEVLDTIPYEVLTSVSPRVKRIYFRE